MFHMLISSTFKLDGSLLVILNGWDFVLFFLDFMVINSHVLALILVVL